MLILLWLGSLAGTREEDRSLWEGGEKGEAFVGGSKLLALLGCLTLWLLGVLCFEGTASDFGVVQTLCASSQNQDLGDKLCLKTSQASHLCP